MTTASIKNPVGRPPKELHQRERILKEAARQIATLGYERCSLGEIAKRLDLTRPAVYHYFKTKQEIFDDIVLGVMKDLYDFVATRVAAVDDSAGQLETLMLAHAEFFEANYCKLVAGDIGYGGVSRQHLTNLHEVETFRSKYKNLLLAILRRGVKRGEFRDIDVKSTMLAIYSMLNMGRWYRPDGPRRATYFAAEYFRLVHAGLRINP